MTGTARPSTARHAGVVAAGTALSGLLAVGLLAPPALAGAPRHTPHAALEHELDALVAEDGYPGALAAVSDARGRVRDLTAGVGDVSTGAPVPVDGQVRVGSNTKTFTAVVVLQLVGEGAIALDEPIETYLPGLVRGEGLDGREITVRQLLQHTSGISDYARQLVPGWAASDFHRFYEPHELVTLGLEEPALFPPGTDFTYSNTNYVLAGLLVQQVTGRPVGEEITRRVIEPLHLRDTYWPGEGEQRLRDRHPHSYSHAYSAAEPGTPPADVTVMDVSMGWAAGALVSTPRDLLRFSHALISGELLRPELLTEMQQTVPAAGTVARGEEGYGLGLQTYTLSCGGVAWGHGGDLPGTHTRNAVTTDGRGAVVVITGDPTTEEQAIRLEETIDTAICG
ncbi:serine hydrolase domain-containing protein [Modestobacter sp. SYSU DS0657]